MDVAVALAEEAEVDLAVEVAVVEARVGVNSEFSFQIQSGMTTEILYFYSCVHFSIRIQCRKVP